MRGDLGRRAALARQTKLPLIAVNDVVMHVPERRALADVVTCIRRGLTLENAGTLLAANAERHLKPPHEMARLFEEAPEAIGETIRFLDGLTFSLDELRYDYPQELREGFASEQEALEAFTWAGAAARYPQGVPPSVAQAIRHELRLIAELNYAAYFLTVHDIVRYARARAHSLPRPRLGGQFHRLLSAWGSPRSIRHGTIFCSNASFRPNATSRPTSMSISSTNGARR